MAGGGNGQGQAPRAAGQLQDPALGQVGDTQGVSAQGVQEVQDGAHLGAVTQ